MYIVSAIVAGGIRMRAVTIRQPWATLIAVGEKRFETRSWATKHRGHIAIHAGKVIDNKACQHPEIKAMLAKHGYFTPSDLPIGAVIATGIVTDCWQAFTQEDKIILESAGRIKHITAFEEIVGNYTEGRYAWELDQMKLLQEPISAKGYLSLWNWENE